MSKPRIPHLNSLLITADNIMIFDPYGSYINSLRFFADTITIGIDGKKLSIDIWKYTLKGTNERVKGAIV